MKRKDLIDNIRRPGEVRIYHRVAYALAVIGLPVVHRGTLRALLPQGATKRVRMVSQRYNLYQSRRAKHQGTNTVSEAFGKVLHALERDGLISRGQEFVAVHNHRALLDRALEEFGPNTPPILLELGAAAEFLTLDLRQAYANDRSEAWIAQRSRELEAVQRLMIESPASLRHRGRGAYAPVPKPESLL